MFGFKDSSFWVILIILYAPHITDTTTQFPLLHGYPTGYPGGYMLPHGITRIISRSFPMLFTLPHEMPSYRVAEGYPHFDQESSFNGKSAEINMGLVMASVPLRPDPAMPALVPQSRTVEDKPQDKTEIHNVRPVYHEQPLRYPPKPYFSYYLPGCNCAHESNTLCDCDTRTYYPSSYQQNRYNKLDDRNYYSTESHPQMNC